MRKTLLIALKDVKLLFRDRAALIFMFLAPLALTIGLGMVTGGFSNGADSGINNIPVVVVNEDGGMLGEAFVEMVKSEDLDDLLEPQFTADPDSARTLVDDDKAAAAVIIPEGFTNSIIPQNTQSFIGETVDIELYGNPNSPTSLGIVKNILEQFLTQVETNRVRGEVTITQLLQVNAIDLSQVSTIGQSIVSDQMTSTDSNGSLIQLNNVNAEGKEVKFNILAVIAPSMALMFLMFTVTSGGRSLLVEMNGGTLPRLLVSPTSIAQVLAGKVLGIFFNGMAQMLILVLATTLIFKLDWGDPIAVVVLIACAVFAATGWGILMAAGLKTPGQISNIGSALMLIFGILGGGFVSVSAMPEWVQFLGRISPNSWGLDGFTTLALGGTLANILTPIIGLMVMAILLFLIAVILFSRRGIGKQ